MKEPVPERQLWVWYTPFGLGGVETFLERLGRATAQKGTEIWVAGIQSFDGPGKGRLERAGVRLLDWSGFYPAYMGQACGPEICRRLVDDLATVRPVLLSINGCSDFGTGAAPLLRRLRPYCTLLEVFHVDAPDDQYLLLRRPYRDTLDGVVSSSARMLTRFRDRLPEATHLPGRYIPYGVEISAQPRRPAGDKLRLVYVGRLVQEQKRILEMPAVLEALRGTGRAFEMTIVGEGPQRAELETRLARCGLSSQVRFAGRVSPEEAGRFYLDHDVLLNFSTYEGFSISVIEALAAGCVPVCTDLPGRDLEVLVDGVTCLVCPVDGLDRMGRMLAGLTSERHATMSAAARRAGSQLTVARMCQEYDAFVADLRARRPLHPWPSDSRVALAGDWDLTRHNPWLPRPNRLRR